MTTDLEISYQAMLVYVANVKETFRSFIGQFLPDILRQV